MNKTYFSKVLLSLLFSSTAIANPIFPKQDFTYKPQVAGFYNYQFGDYQVTALFDGNTFLEPSIFQNISSERVMEILKKYYIEQHKEGIDGAVNAFLVNTGKSFTLVDSGASSCYGDQLGSILKNLEASGHQPAQVDTVLLTHLHLDHVCGVSRYGKANYPNATLYVSQDEYDYWFNPKQLEKIPEANKQNFLYTVQQIKVAIAPYEANKRLKTFKVNDSVNGFKVISTPGHTPGHFSYELSSNNEKLVFIGDIVNSHSIQFDQPNVSVLFDVDPKIAVKTRLKQFTDFAKNGQTIAAPHLPFPGIGNIYSKDGKSYQWIPTNFKN